MDNNSISPSPISKKSRFKIILFASLIFVVLCAGGLITGYIFLGQLTPYDFYIEGEGFYSIDQVILTNALDNNGQPMSSKNVFRPSEPIISWVSTKGADGIIGMRWFYGEQMIFEHFGKTQDNLIYTYIQSSDAVKLEEGDYRVEIHTTGGTPHETLYFTVEQYRPKVVPAQPTPVSHQRIEAPSEFVEVPFVFDEVWNIDGTDWPINEVKIVFLDDGSVFVVVTVQVQIDPTKLSKDAAKEFAKPIALYAVQNGYLEQGRSLEIDGEFYPLDEVLFVNLAKSLDENRTLNNRVLFELDELLDQ
ncbi:MAG: hypothetical protein H3C64_13355 [Candidatus Kuenenia stuttgartiensis]|nr:hypothetical protein [Candidatus Kuenenia stuttgartiensis]